MSRSVCSSQRGLLPGVTLLMAVMALMKQNFPTANAFTLQHSSPRTKTSLSAAMNRKSGKFNKQNDLAAKMAQAKQLREGGSSIEEEQTITNIDNKKELSPGEVKLRNDKQRFADMLENSLTGGGDLEKGYYMTEDQENENADAVFRGVIRLYEGDPAPTTPFTQLLNIENGQPLGKGGMKRFVPWEGSRTNASEDYLVVITDPRPKSIELRTAMNRMVGALSADVLRKCVVINTDSPAENRRFLKKSFGDGVDFGVLVDEDRGWMKEYTALGETRFSMTIFVLRDGKVEKIVREVEAEVLPMVISNAIRSLT